MAICGITKLFVGELVETGAFLTLPHADSQQGCTRGLQGSPNTKQFTQGLQSVSLLVVPPSVASAISRGRRSLQYANLHVDWLLTQSMHRRSARDCSS